MSCLLFIVKEVRETLKKVWGKNNGDLELHCLWDGALSCILYPAPLTEAIVS